MFELNSLILIQPVSRPAWNPSQPNHNNFFNIIV